MTTDPLDGLKGIRVSIGRSAASAAFAAALLFPLLIAAVDHHGVERVPTHEHLFAGGWVAPTHAHLSELPHDHPARAADGNGVHLIPVAPLVPLMASVTVTVVDSLSVLIACLLALLAVERTLRGFSIHRPVGSRADGVRIAPPTGPPRRALLSS